MDDHFYLEALMHGEVIKKMPKEIKSKIAMPQNRFEKAYAQSISAYADVILEQENLVENKLIPKHIQKIKIESELKESTDLSIIGTHINEALHIFNQEGMHYLEEEEFKAAQENFAHTVEVLNKINLNQEQKNDFGHLLQIHEKSVSALFQVACEKFKEGEYNSSFSIFVLLTILHPEIEEYWYRLGLIAQQMENYDLALRAYAVANRLNPELIGARIFASECYLQLNQIQDALLEYHEAEKIIASGSAGFASTEWTSVLAHVKALIQSKPL